MSIIQRLGDLIEANLNELLEKAENPVRMIRQLVRKLDDEIIIQRGRLQAADARIKRRRERLDKAVALQDTWTRRAEEALDRGDDDQAREALKARMAARESSHDLERAWWEACQQRDDIVRELSLLENRAQEARRTKESLLRRHRGEEPSSSFIAVPEAHGQSIDCAEIEEELNRLKQHRQT